MIFCFGIRLSSSKELAYPSLVQSFSFFTVFFMASVLWLFCFDFFEFNNLYFFNQNIQVLVLFVACLICIISRDFLISQRILKMEYDFLFLFVVFSGLCLCFADDFLIFYIAIEIQSLAFYVFASFHRNSEFSTEAGLKYFVFGAIMSCFLLIGFSFVYLLFGSSSFETLFSLAITKSDELLFLGLLFVLTVLLFKVGSAPFHI
jgi:NADH-quinone oxidoreductase subunit N